MKELDEESAKQEVDEYIHAHFDPRAKDLWQIVEDHLKKPSDHEKDKP